MISAKTVEEELHGLPAYTTFFYFFGHDKFTVRLLVFFRFSVNNFFFNFDFVFFEFDLMCEGRIDGQGDRDVVADCMCKTVKANGNDVVCDGACQGNIVRLYGTGKSQSKSRHESFYPRTTSNTVLPRIKSPFKQSSTIDFELYRS